jgi:hydrogenase maturation protein HypF
VIAPTATPERKRLRVHGVVQGVGFRPHVYNLAHQFGLVGFVGNDSSGVFVEVEGPRNSLLQFEHLLTTHPPPMARIEQICAQDMPLVSEASFTIVESRGDPNTRTFVSPDLAICDDCLRELFDPSNRRYRYPFVNCTHCGPRFTITIDTPYDRPLTTMAGFALCTDCQREYDDPTDRRFHAQPIACPQCGPQLSLFVGGRWVAHKDTALQQALEIIQAGGIVAVKGLGGFHLACDAQNANAVQLLRTRKGRMAKPFAVMARDLAAITQFAELTELERTLLTSRERPIVILQRRPCTITANLIAPDTNTIGVMLPYTPLHHLLVRDATTPLLVMTSANHSEEPIVTHNHDALATLGMLADAILAHDRDIHVPCDDSVVRVFAGAVLPLRRSRGYAPLPITLPFQATATLAMGAALKSTFCLAVDDHALISQHIGDLENLETLRAFEHALTHMQTLFRIAPERIAVDLHPGYMSTRWAAQHAHGRQVIGVQHHHAHIAALMVEHGIDRDGRVIGFVFDGTGYGTDGATWGGEALIASYAKFTRAAHLTYTPLPGGDAAIRHPYRSGLAQLWAAGIAWHPALAPVAACAAVERAIVQRMLEMRTRVVSTSSMGRLFDAVASLAGVCQHAQS